MTLELIKWSPALKQELIDICNDVDRTFLSNRLPYPYTEESADWWLGMVSGHDGKDGVFRAISVDGKIVGNISVEQKADVYCKDGEIGYLLLTPCWSRGIMTEAVRQDLRNCILGTGHHTHHRTRVCTEYSLPESPGEKRFYSGRPAKECSLQRWQYF